MIILEWLFIFLIFYFLYRLVFNFIIPVYRASSQIRSKMSEMNQQFNQRPPASEPREAAKPAQQKPAAGDYIEFEEIK